MKPTFRLGGLLAAITGVMLVSGLTQAEVAARVGTTQSAIARLESGMTKHSPSLATLQRYARALGYKVEVRLVKEHGLTSGGRKHSRT